MDDNGHVWTRTTRGEVSLPIPNNLRMPLDRSKLPAPSESTISGHQHGSTNANSMTPAEVGSSRTAQADVDNEYSVCDEQPSTPQVTLTIPVAAPISCCSGFVRLAALIDTRCAGVSRAKRSIVVQFVTTSIMLAIIALTLIQVTTTSKQEVSGRSSTTTIVTSTFVEDNNVDYSIGLQPTIINVSELKSAVYLSSKARRIAPNAFVFDKPLTSVNSPFANIISTSRSAVYWFQLAAGVPANTQTNTRLNGLAYPLVVYTTTTNFPDDVIVTDTIQHVNHTSNTQLNVSNSETVFGTTDNYTGTSLLAFRLDNIVKEHVYFAVQRTSSTQINFQITFDRVLMNVGNAWNVADSSFRPLRAGIYFLTFTASAPSSTKVDMTMKRNGAGVAAVGIYEIGSGQHNGIMTGRYSAMWGLNVGDVITFHSESSVHSTADGLVNVQGFLYSPLDGAAVAWNVARTMWFDGPISVLSYDLVHINLMSVWSVLINKVTIPLKGTYCVDLTTYICSGTDNNPELQVMLNTKAVITIRLHDFLVVSGSCITRSRSAILRLQVGDELYVTAPAGGRYFSNLFRQHSFTGFRLF